FRGPSATAGYHGNPDATARLFRGPWLDTGDVGYIAGGELFLTSRAKDLIKRGGHNIHPYDLEAAVGDIPGIRKGCVAVFGTMDRGTGTERVAVVAETNLTDREAREALRQRIMALAVIHLNGPADDVRLVPARTILKTSSGKIRRAACRDLYERGLLEAPRPAVWRQIALLVAQALVARSRRALRGIGEAAYGVWAWLAFVLPAAVGVLALPLLPTAPARMRLAQAMARGIVRSLGVPVAVAGLEHLRSDRPTVLVANHASYVDAIVLVATLPPHVRYVAKREFLRSPVLGSALRRLGTYFVERVDPARGVEDTRELVAAARRGETLVFFPEGGFSRAPGIRAFRIGAFVVAAEAGVPVTPVVLRGTRSLLREHRWLLTRGRVELDIHPPLSPDGADWSAAVRLRDRTRAIMLGASGEPDLAG
ncbi:MAG: 1-acyl-sn-glycerol-3-phosphate acyltransferase, partial [Candidatus Levyibacteriota bacterium]